MFFNTFELVSIVILLKLTILMTDGVFNNNNVGVDSSYFCRFGCNCVCNLDEKYCRIYCRDQELIIDKTNLYDKTNFNYVIKELTINNQNWTELNKSIGKSDLELLDLSDNNIRSIKSGVFKYQLNLKELRLNNNGLKYIDVDAFRNTKSGYQHNFDSLVTLDMTNNSLTTLEGSIFSSIINLQVLNLSRNPLNDINRQTIVAIQTCINLEVLNISKTKLFYLPQGFLENFDRLITIDLSNNYLEAVPTSLNHSSIRNLYLNNNPIVSLELYNSFPTVNVTNLYMCNMKNLTNVGRNVFGQLKRLNVLYLCNNPLLKYIDPLAFQNVRDNNVTKLQELHMENNLLSNINQMLLNWNNMDFFNVSGNPWICDCNLTYLLEAILPLTVKFRDDHYYLRYTGQNMKCMAPEKYKGKSLYEIVRKDIYLTCKKDENLTSGHGLNGVAIFGLSISIILALVLVIFGIYVYFPVNRRVGSFREMIVAYAAQPQDELPDEDEVTL